MPLMGTVRFCGLVIASLMFTPTYAWPQTTRVHFLGIADTDAPGVGPHVQAALSKVASAVLAPIPDSRKQEHESLVGSGCEIDNILTKVNGLPIPQGDTVVVYYVGHGAFDPTLGTLFLPHLNPARALPMRSIIEALQRKRPRLIVLLVDCCQTPVSGQIVMPREIVGNGVANVVPPLAQSLYFDAEPGTLIMFATERNQAVPCGVPSFNGNLVPGTLFSEAFAHCMSTENQPLGWKAFGLKVKTRVNETFAKHRRDAEGRLILANDQRAAVTHQRVFVQKINTRGQLETLIAPR